MKVVITLIILVSNFIGCTNCDNLKIGQTYVIGKHEVYVGDDPFDPYNTFITNPATVTIENIQNGYVKYCWYYDYNIPNHVSFSRSMSEFEDLIDDAK